MTEPERRKRVEDLCDAALDRDARERAEFVAVACGRDEALRRAEVFARDLDLRMPILLAPMAGATPVALSVAVAEAGGLGACGVVSMEPEDITAWVRGMREGSDRPFQLNTWTL